MDTYDAIATKLDVREFAQRHIADGTKAKVLEAARLTGSSMNSQHWRFILVSDPGNLKMLAQDSTTGSWVKEADFAVIVNVDPNVPGSVIDAGRAAQDMQLAAWNEEVASGVFTGVKKGGEERLRHPRWSELCDRSGVWLSQEETHRP